MIAVIANSCPCLRSARAEYDQQLANALELAWRRAPAATQEILGGLLPSTLTAFSSAPHRNNRRPTTAAAPSLHAPVVAEQVRGRVSVIAITSRVDVCSVFCKRASIDLYEGLAAALHEGLNFASGATMAPASTSASVASTWSPKTAKHRAGTRHDRSRPRPDQG